MLSWCLQFVLCPTPRVLWPMQWWWCTTLLSQGSKERNRSVIITMLLRLPLAFIVEEFKAGKVCTAMILHYSKDEKIRENPPKFDQERSGSWMEETVNKTIKLLDHKIVGQGTMKHFLSHCHENGCISDFPVTLSHSERSPPVATSTFFVRLRRVE